MKAEIGLANTDLNKALEFFSISKALSFCRRREQVTFYACYETFYKGTEWKGSFKRIAFIHNCYAVKGHFFKKHLARSASVSVKPLFAKLIDSDA